jgi:hypothetical protein
VSMWRSGDSAKHRLDNARWHHLAEKLKARDSRSCGRRPRRGIIAICSSWAMVRAEAEQGSCARMNLAMRGAISARKREPLKMP